MPARGERAVARAPERRQRERQHRLERRERVRPRGRERRRTTDSAERAEQLPAHVGGRRAREEEQVADADVVAARRAHDREAERVDPDRQRRRGTAPSATTDARRRRTRAGRAASGTIVTANTPSVTHDATTIDRPVTAFRGYRPRGPTAERSPRATGARARRRGGRTRTRRPPGAAPPRPSACRSSIVAEQTRRSRRAPRRHRAARRRSPVSPSATASCEPPLARRPPGTPHAAASRNTIPKPSASSPRHRSRQHIANTSAQRVERGQVGVGDTAEELHAARAARRSRRRRSRPAPAIASCTSPSEPARPRRSRRRSPCGARAATRRARAGDRDRGRNGARVAARASASSRTEPLAVDTGRDHDARQRPARGARRGLRAGYEPAATTAAAPRITRRAEPRGCRACARSR